MSHIRDIIKKVRFEQGQQSIASPFQFEEGLQTKVPTSTLIRNKIKEVRQSFFQPTEDVRVRDVAREIPKTIKKATEFFFPPRRKILTEIEEERGQTLTEEEARKAIIEKEKELFIVRAPRIFDRTFEGFLEAPAVEIPFLAGRVQSINQIKKVINRKVLKILSKQDLIDITRGAVTSGEKFDLYTQIVADPTLKRELVNLARNKKISLTQKVGNFIDDIFKKAEVPSDPKQIRGAIQKVRAEQKAIVPVTNKIKEVEKITGFKHIMDFKGIFQFQDRKKDLFRVILEEGDTVEQMLEKIRKVKKFDKKFAPQVAKLQREFDVFTGERPKPISPDLQPLAQEARKFDTAQDFVNRMSIEVRDELRQQGIKGEVAITNFWKKNVTLKEPVLNTLNPTGGLFVEHTPKERATIKLGKNITTLDKTSGKTPDTTITIYRGAPKIQKEIVAGDFITTNFDLAKSYTGEENVISKKVKMRDVLDDITEPLGEEYIYRPFNQVKGVEKPVEPIKKVFTEEGRFLKRGEEIVAPRPKNEKQVETFIDKGERPSEIANAMRIDPELGKLYRQNPSQTPDYIAMRIMKDERKIPAIRKDSGVYAPKEFEEFKFKDIRGVVTGARGVSFNFRDASFSFDNITAKQASLQGEWGAMAKLWHRHEETLANRFIFVGTKSAQTKSLAQKHGVKINKETGQQLFDAFEGKTQNIPENIVELAKEITDQILNITREEANTARVAMGKKEIGFLDNYIPHMQAIDFWRTVITDAKTTITDNFDFIIPNAKKNPHAIHREGGLQDLETNAWKLIESYVDNLSNDIYISPQIEQLKAVNSVLQGRELFGMSRFIDSYIRNNLVGKAGQLDSFFGVTEGSLPRTVLQKVNLARNISALAFNIVWSLTVQPASLVLTAARGGGIMRGTQNMITGFTKFAFSTERNQRVRKLPTLIVKTEGASIGMTGAGDIDRIAGQIFKTKLETFNDFVGKMADGIEYWLTGGSMSVGYDEAAKLGLKGESADIFANWLGGATQSAYNKQARPMFLNNLTVRTAFPFQTYAFELWRFVKTLAGKQGGIPLGKGQRISQLIMLIAGGFLYNEMSARVTGRKLFTIGSAIPVVGGFVDEMIIKGKVALGFQKGQVGTGRSPIAPQEDVKNFISAVDVYVNKDNIAPLRKELIKWGMGFTGVSGASTVNRFVDGMIANTQGYMTTRSGDPAFIIEGTDKFIAPLLGPYSTEAGKKYLKQQEIKEVEQRNIKPTFEEVQSLLEEGRDKEAQTIVDALSAEDYEIYKQLKSKDKAEKKAEGVKAMIPFVQEARELIEKGKDTEAQQIVDDLTDEEYRYYQDAKKKLDKLQKAKDGKTPSFLDGEVIDDRSLVEIIAVHAEAFGTAPIDSFKAIFKGETIRRVDNRTVIVFRLPFSESQAIRSEWADGGDLTILRLDHIVPLQLGGDNSKDNLQLIPIELWRGNTPIENHLGKLLRDNKIEKKEAKELIIQYKNGDISADEILKL